MDAREGISFGEFSPRPVPRCGERDWSLDIPEENPNGIQASSPGLARRAYPGETVEKPPTPTGLCLDCGLGRNPVGVGLVPNRLPRVARSSQPWALRQNPFGIPDCGRSASAGGGGWCGAPTPSAHSGRNRATHPRALGDLKRRCTRCYWSQRDQFHHMGLGYVLGRRPQTIQTARK